MTRPPIRLCIFVTFHYVEARLPYLRSVVSQFGELAEAVDATVVTNADRAEALKTITDLDPGNLERFATFTPFGLGHPYLLPWSHFVVAREKILDASFTHFLYLEDDLLVTQQTIRYLLAATDALRRFGLLPAVFRVEMNDRDGEWHSTDLVERVRIEACARILPDGSDTGFINLNNPYQAMYFLDRNLMIEHLNSLTSTPDFGAGAMGWGIRERASQGLMFLDVPKGYLSRFVVPYRPADLQIPAYARIHHLPNNYVHDPTSPLGKIRLRDVLY